MPRLSRKAAIITGGGSGIGRATARLFATEGASVAIFDCDRASADEVVESLRPSGLDGEQRRYVRAEVLRCADA